VDKRWGGLSPGTGRLKQTTLTSRQLADSHTHIQRQKIKREFSHFTKNFRINLPKGVGPKQKTKKHF